MTNIYTIDGLSQCWPTVMVIILKGFLMFDQISLSPQVKRIVIIRNEHGIHELSHKLPNDFLIPTAFSLLGGGSAHTRKKTQDFGKLGNIRKISRLHKIIA